MDYYQKEFIKLKEEFHEVMHDYPLFSEDIKEIEEKKLKEINELLEKNDIFYFKQAIDKLKDLIDYIKKTSESIKNQYNLFDKLAHSWEEIKISNVSKEELDNVNDKVRLANRLIKSHDIKDLEEANRIMENLIKDYRK